MRRIPQNPGSLGAAALLVVVSGCDIGLGDSLGPIVNCTATAFAGAFTSFNFIAAGAGQPQPIVDDTGVTVQALQGLCVSNDCDPRVALAGSRLFLSADWTALASQRALSGADATLALKSTDPAIIGIEDGTRAQDACDEHTKSLAKITFLAAGEAAIVVMHGATELNHFSFEVVDDARLELTVSPAPRSQEALAIEQTGDASQSVRGSPQAMFTLQPRAFDASGRPMLADYASFNIDDPNVVGFLVTDMPDPTLGARSYVVLRDEGSTTIHVDLGGLMGSVAVQIDPSLPASEPPPAGGSPGDAGR